MVAWKFLTALTFAFVGLTFGLDIEEDEDVLVLTDSNFKDAIKEHSPLLVEFYAPWCGHCKSLAPEYAKAAKTLKAEGIRIAKLDATAHTETSQAQGIQGFPTLKLFKGDAVIKYESGRTAEAIVNWIRKKTGPATKSLTTEAELGDFTGANEVVVLGVYKNLEGEEKKLLDAIADADDQIVYAVTNSDAIKKKLKITADNALVLLKKFDEGRNDYSGDLKNKEEIADFVKSNSLPLVITFSDKNAQKIFGGDYDTHLLTFLDVENQKDANKAALETVAKKFRGKLLVIIVPSHEDRIVDYFAVKKDEMPRALVVKMAGGIKKFEHPARAKNFDADDLSAFLDDYFAGKLKPTLKSEEIPENDDEAVKTIVGKNFEEVVLNHGGKHDVLMEFYAPWCGHCKALAPKYEELAEKFADIPSLIIAKMDSTANEIDHPKVNIQGFPTIKFFPANDPNNPIDYDGGRDVASFVSFLQQKVTIGFEIDGEVFGPGPGKTVKHEEL